MIERVRHRVPCESCGVFSVEGTVYLTRYRADVTLVCRLCAHALEAHGRTIEDAATYRCDCPRESVYGSDFCADVDRRVRAGLVHAAFINQKGG